jgi:hypothetical protein
VEVPHPLVSPLLLRHHLHMGALTDAEQARLTQLERVVEHGRAAYAEAADALYAIRKERLYRPLTWPQYVRRRFGQSYSWCYDLLRWREVVVSTGVEISQGAARVLAPLPADERRRIVEVARRIAPDAHLTARLLRRAKCMIQRPGGTPCSDLRLTHGDFRDSPPEPGAATLILTDPPYGTDWLPNWSDLGEWASIALKDGGLLVSYSPTGYLPDVLNLLGRNLTYVWTVARTLHQGVGGWSAMLNGRSLWTPIVVFCKGRHDRRGLSDLIAGGAWEGDWHVWQKPVIEAVQVIERVTAPGDLVLDPCCGSGTVGAACAQTGRRFRGWEIEAETYSLAAARLGISSAAVEGAGQGGAGADTARTSDREARSRSDRPLVCV